MKAFLYPITSELLFCRRCQKSVLIKFLLVSRTPLGVGFALIFLCSVPVDLFHTLLLFTNSIFCDSHKSEYVKILGYNRIIPGNWLYVKGTLDR